MVQEFLDTGARIIVVTVDDPNYAVKKVGYW